MAILHVVLYSTVDVECFYKTSFSILPMPHARCKSIANEHTLLNRKHICDANERLCIRDFTQLG
jgi:hypothetical protein